MTAFESVTRLGFAARGLMYGAIGWLAVQSGRTEDPRGILALLATRAGGILVAVMALGFFSYGAWRLLEAWLDGERHGRDARGIGVRLAYAGSGLIHFGFGTAAILAALHARQGGGDAQESGTAIALAMPGGRWFVYLAAAVLAGVAIHQFRKAWTLKFMRHLDCAPAAHRWVCWLGRAGYAARGALFLTMGWLLVRAAEVRSPGEAGGIDDALASLPRTAQLAVAAGVILFGLFSLTEARCRRMPATR